MEEITLIYTEGLLKKAVRSFWWRTTGPFFLAVVALMVFGTIYLFLKGNWTWLVGFMGTASLIGISFLLILYISHYRNTLGKFRALNGTNPTFITCSEHFEIESCAGKTTMRWLEVQELWKFKDYWLVFLSKSQFFTLPVSCLSESNKKSIVNYIKIAGGKIF